MKNTLTSQFFNTLVYVNSKKRVVMSVLMFTFLLAILVAPQMVVFAGGSTSRVCPGGC